MTLLVPGLVVGVVLWLVHKSKSSGGAASLPSGSGPPGDGWKGPGAATNYTVPGGSRATYTIWSWARADQTYTVARLAASTAWISFTTIGGHPTPAKTNVTSDPDLLAQMRSDWGM